MVDVELVDVDAVLEVVVVDVDAVLEVVVVDVDRTVEDVELATAAQLQKLKFNQLSYLQ